MKLTLLAVPEVTTGMARPADITLTIDASKPVGRVNPIHYGLMTEEINFSYDGGLYAELIRNRSFQNDAQTPHHWSVRQGDGAQATMTLDKERPRNEQQPVSLRVEVTAATKEHPAGVANEGYWGIPVRPRTRYTATVYARAARGLTGPLTLSIQSEDGTTTYAKATVASLSEEWKSYTVTLTTGKVTPTAKNRFAITTEKPGTFWLGYVSLFPPTYKNRPNGLRPDLMQMLVDLKPGFLRFPGGNYLEGNTIAERFEWKKTLGPPAERPGHPCPWGYRSTDGMGLMEFLLWCEDMGAEPLLGLYAGYSLHGDYIKPGPDLVPFVEDALEEIEYVIGDKNTKWGAARIRDGHPAPFPLHYVEVGNEDWFDKSGSYDGRFAQFYDAIKAKYPQLKVISSVGTEQAAEKRVTSRKPDALDEHYYRSTAEFLNMGHHHYEHYPRTNGPEIFVGEWAAYEEILPWDPRSQALPPTPSMKAAIGDAAWMTAMERNADLVTMHCYAPLLVNVNPGGRQWRPNQIGYDALTVFGSPSYYAFQMFSCHHGGEILSATLPETTLHGSVTRDSKTGTITVKLVNPDPAPQPVKIEITGVAALDSTATALTLAADPMDTNALDNPKKVIPVRMKISNVKPGFTCTVPAYSITVLELKTR